MLSPSLTRWTFPEKCISYTTLSYTAIHTPTASHLPVAERSETELLDRLVERFTWNVLKLSTGLLLFLDPAQAEVSAVYDLRIDLCRVLLQGGIIERAIGNHADNPLAVNEVGGWCHIDVVKGHNMLVLI